MDISKVKANGPWVLVLPEEPKRLTDSGIYLPEGNLYERIGHLVGVVVSAGKGSWETNKSGKKFFMPMEVSAGNRVVFRGHLKDANKVGDKHCFMHQKDLIMILDKDAELGLAVPYDN